MVYRISQITITIFPCDSSSRLIAQQILAHILEGILKLLHPFMPYLTEEIWQTLTKAEGQSLALQSYPEVEATLINLELESEFELLIGTIRTLRNLRAEAEIKPGLKVPVILQTENSTEQQILEQGKTYIQELAKVESLTITSNLTQTNQQASAGIIGTIQALIPLTGIIDIDALKTKLNKKLTTLETKIASLSGLLITLTSSIKPLMM